VTEQRIFAHAAFECGLEGIHVVDALAGVGAFAEEILIHVGHGGGVRIDAAHAGEDALEQRSLPADRQRRRDARLQHAVAFDDASGNGIEPRMVQRVRHLADQPARRLPRHPGIGVERDDVTNAGRRSGRRGVRRPADTYEARIGRAAEQPVKLVELAALAFPPDPALLPFVPDSPAMEQKKAVPPRFRSVGAVQAGDARGGRLQKRVISFNGLVRGVGPVRQQCEIELAFRTRKVVDLKALDLLFELGLRREKRRDDDHRAQVRRYAVAELQARQDRGAELHRNAAVYERHRRIDSRDQPEKREDTEPPVADSHSGQREQRQGENDRSDHEDAADIAADAELRVPSSEPAAPGSTKTDRRLERATPPGDQVIAGIALAAMNTVTR
jgi:hypothetical protein